jgi:hypothetical protein
MKIGVLLSVFVAHGCTALGIAFATVPNENSDENFDSTKTIVMDDAKRYLSSSTNCVVNEGQLHSRIQAASTSKYTTIEICVSYIKLTKSMIDVTGKWLDLRCVRRAGKHCALDGRKKESILSRNKCSYKNGQNRFR